MSVNSNKKNENKQFTLVGCFMAVEVLNALHGSLQKLRLLSSPGYSLFHPPCSHPQRIDVCRRVKACAQGNVDMLSLTLATCFVVVFFVLIHTSKEETLNVKPNSMRVCVSRQNWRFSNPTTIESTDATFAWMRPDA